MRFGEELLRIRREQRLLLFIARDANRKHPWIRNARLLRMDAFIPQPRDVFDLGPASYADMGSLGGGLGQGQPNPPRIIEIGHRLPLIPCALGLSKGALRRAQRACHLSAW